MTNVWVEFGPVTVRRLHPQPVVIADQEMTQMALGGLDDPLVLINEIPTQVDSLLRLTLESVIGRNCDSLTLVFPSGWPKNYCDRIVDAAKFTVKDVVALRRSRLFAEFGDSRLDPMVLVEFSYSHVAISLDTQVLAILARPITPERVLAELDVAMDPSARYGAPQTIRQTTMYLDVPVGIEADLEVAAIRQTYASRDGSVVCLDIGAIVAQHFRLEQSPDHRGRTGRSRACAQLIVAMCVLVAVSAVAVRFGANTPVQLTGAQDDTDLVEGRVTVRVPKGWKVDRITAGPGSQRVRVAPERAETTQSALHITQLYAPGQQLADVAATLRQIMKDEAPEIFTGFTADDSTFDRSTVAYRELRTGRVTRWFVFMDGSMRIGIGCQSAVGHELALDVPCGVAVRSARELRGAA